jgi:hypothetical protein
MLNTIVFIIVYNSLCTTIVIFFTIFNLIFKFFSSIIGPFEFILALSYMFFFFNMVELKEKKTIITKGQNRWWFLILD